MFHLSQFFTKNSLYLRKLRINMYILYLLLTPPCDTILNIFVSIDLLFSLLRNKTTPYKF